MTQKLKNSKTGISSQSCVQASKLSIAPPVSQTKIPNIESSRYRRVCSRFRVLLSARARSRLFSRSLAAAEPESASRSPADRASIDDNNYRVTMNDFLIRLLLEDACLSRFPRICMCVCVCLCTEKISDRLSPTVYRLLPSLEITRALLERIPISDMQIDLPARPLLRNRRISGRRWCICQPRRAYLRGDIVELDLYSSMENAVSTLRSQNRFVRENLVPTPRCFVASSLRFAVLLFPRTMISRVVFVGFESFKELVERVSIGLDVDRHRHWYDEDEEFVWILCVEFCGVESE